jgi:hypothetical protein
MDHVERLRFVVAREIAEVIPRVVMQKSAVGMGAFAFNVIQKSAAHAAGGDADDAGVSDFVAFAERKFAIEFAADAAGSDDAGR